MTHLNLFNLVKTQQKRFYWKQANLSVISTCGLAKYFLLTLLEQSNDRKLFLAGIMVLSVFACWQKGSFGLIPLLALRSGHFFPRKLIINHKALKNVSLLFGHKINDFRKIVR